ncbi:hypothetical protein HY968_03890 [Candidatus Kaiserbacteria bacterium]|nr:hypothetical protein [Candidatus Kaiserbacteria bacterium]
METARTGFLSLSPLGLTAVFSVVVLALALVWQSGVFHANVPLVAVRPDSGGKSTASNSLLSDLPYVSPISSDIAAQILSAYANNVARNGSYSSEDGVKAATKIASDIMPAVNYTSVTAGDVKTDPDVSSSRVLAYRADLRVALEPLLLNKDMELEIFGRYIESGDVQYLNALGAAAVNYRKAAGNASALKVPADAAVYHAAILNAMNEFAATLDAMASNASDPFASAALLKTYNQAQADMLASFGEIGAYAARKTL